MQGPAGRPCEATWRAGWLGAGISSSHSGRASPALDLLRHQLRAACEPSGFERNLYPCHRASGVRRLRWLAEHHAACMTPSRGIEPPAKPRLSANASRTRIRPWRAGSAAPDSEARPGGNSPGDEICREPFSGPRAARAPLEKIKNRLRDRADLGFLARNSAVPVSAMTGWPEPLARGHAQFWRQQILPLVATN